MAGNFGTVIVHADELHQKTTQHTDSAVSDSAVPSGTGGRLANSGYLRVCLPSLPIFFKKAVFFYSQSDIQTVLALQVCELYFIFIL